MDAQASNAEIEKLLAHSAWLTALAHRLVRDPATADDLVQDTWHAALRSPNGGDRGWLATVIANLARAHARAAGARREREQRTASSEELDGPDDLVERAESQRNLLAHVLALEEPYRSTLLARFVEGRSSAQIARRTGVNESTVRTRLSRALDQLRARLSSEHREDRRLGLGALLSGRGASAVPTATAAATTYSAAIGAWFMSTSTKIAVVSVLLLGAWLAWKSAAPRATREEPELGLVAPRARVTLPVPIADKDAAPAREVLAVEPAPSETVAEVPKAVPVETPQLTATFDVVFQRDGVPVPGVQAWLAPESSPGWQGFGKSAVLFIDLADLGYTWPTDAPRATSDSAGVAAFRELRRGPYFIAFDLERGAARPTHLVCGNVLGGLRTSQRHEIQLGSSALHGRVFDDLGRPRPGVGVMVHSRTAHPSLHVLDAALCATDANGAYRIGDLRATEYDVVMEVDGHFDGRGPVERSLAVLAASEDRELDFGSTIPAPRWSGRLLTAFDEPFPGTARLELELANGVSKRSVEVDDQGRFQFAFAAGKWRVRAYASGAPNLGFDLGEFDLPATDIARDLVVPGTRLEGRVSAANEGEALPEELLVAAHPKEHDYPAAIRQVSVTEGGHYRIDGLEPGTWVVDVWPGSLDVPLEIEIQAGVRALERDLRWKP